MNFKRLVGIVMLSCALFVTMPVGTAGATLAPPELTVAGSSRLLSWYGTPVTVTLDAPVLLSTKYSLDEGATWQSFGLLHPGIRFDGSGKHSLWYYCEGGLYQEASDIKKVSINLDFEKPKVKGWLWTASSTSSTQLMITASDSQSGVQRLEYSKDGGRSWSDWRNGGFLGNTYVYPFEDLVAIRVRSTDNVGRQSVRALEHLIPVTTASVDQQHSRAPWYNDPLKVELKVRSVQASVVTKYRLDEGPWETYTAPFRVSQDGRHVIRYRSSAGGIEEDQRQIELAIDRTSPSLALYKFDATDVHEHPVAVATDAMSGVRVVKYKTECPPNHGKYPPKTDWDVVPPASIETINGAFAFDAAGNYVSIYGTPPLYIEDRQGPEVNLSLHRPGAVLTGEPHLGVGWYVQVKSSVSDAGVGVRSTSHSANVGKWVQTTAGRNYASVEATDMVGNATRKVISWIGE